MCHILAVHLLLYSWHRDETECGDIHRCLWVVQNIYQIIAQNLMYVCTDLLILVSPPSYQFEQILSGDIFWPVDDESEHGWC